MKLLVLKSQFFFLFVCFLIATVSQTNAQTLEWAKSMGNTSSEIGESITVDASGNIYTIGSFIGSVDFDPNAGILNLISAGNTDIFIQKLNPLGNLIWAKNMGGLTSDFGYSITIDVSGNVYTTGSFTGTADFDPGAGITTLTSAGTADIFIQKLNALGNFVWAKNMGGTGDDIGNSITSDATGNIYITGSFSGTVDFDPNAGTTNLTSAGNTDVFIQKITPLGNLIWAKSIGGSAADIGNSIIIDVIGNVYTTGFFSGIADFDPNFGTINLISSGANDIFISKLDAFGNYVWAKKMGGPSFDIGSSIAIGPSGNIYTTGSFIGIGDFDPSPGIALQTSSGSADVFISKLDPLGDYIWSTRIGGSNFDHSFSIAIDTAENIYTIGYYNGIVDFDPGIGTVNLISAGFNSIFISKLDVSSNFLWAKSMGGIDSDIGRSIAVDTPGNIYTTGYFGASVDFDPGAGTTNLISAGASDIFIQKFNAPCITTDSIFIVTHCNNYTFNGTTYTSNNTTAKDTLINAAGCDSVITLNLTINNTVNSIDLQTACDAFLWVDGNIYTSNNNSASDTIFGGAANGCDSIITLNLTLNNTANSTDLQSACGSFTWIDGITYTSNNNTAVDTLFGGSSTGCDSIVTLNLTVNPNEFSTDTISACNFFTWINGNTYTSNNNTATDTIFGAAANGCDSIIALDLTIINTTGIDTQTACTSYTWINGVVYFSNNNIASFTIVGGAASGCDSIVLLNLTINNNALGTDVQFACNTYTWLDGNTYTAHNNTATITIVGGAFNGCDSIVTLNLTIGNCFADFTVSDSIICESQCIDFIDQSGEALSWLWVFPSGQPDTSFNQNPTICYDTSGAYIATLITTIPGGFDTAIQNITVSTMPTLLVSPDTTINLGESITLFGFGSTSGSYTWSPNNWLSCNLCQTTIASPEETTTYTITLQDSGCAVSDTVLVNVDYINIVFVPNIFSPNEDGKNDILYVQGSTIAQLHFMIYNRWGEKVFETSNINKGWDGNFRGKPLNKAVFVYHLDATFKDGSSTSKKGDITLVR